MKENKILFGEYENYLFFKLVGETTMRNVFSLKKTIKDIDIFQFDYVIIDFSQSIYLDSTSLGIIASLGMKLNKHFGEKRIVFLGFSEELKENFFTFGFDRIVITDLELDLQIESQSLVELKSGGSDFGGSDLLEAHKSLVKLEPKNEKIFKNVIQLMESELKRKENCQ